MRPKEGHEPGRVRRLQLAGEAKPVTAGAPPAEGRPDIAGRDDIAELLRGFYGRAFRDELLGPVFAAP
jgi:hypothetical protein